MADGGQREGYLMRLLRPECYSAALMARRYDHREDGIMSPQEIRDMRNGLSGLSGSAVRHAYQTAYARCRMVNDRVPSARSIQELVQVWKQLWKCR